MNEDFYHDINFLGAFGGGNNEPKFVVENVKVIRSDIIKQNHIKSLLCGKDGSVLKTFAWNAVNTPIETYLNKKKNKVFNILGKMRLNEWKGKKNIEFIIEDISTN